MFEGIKNYIFVKKENKVNKEPLNKLNINLEVYRDKGRQWRWRFFLPDSGEIIANSGKGYKNKQVCVGIVDSILVGVKVVKRVVPK